LGDRETHPVTDTESKNQRGSFMASNSSAKSPQVSTAVPAAKALTIADVPVSYWYGVAAIAIALLVWMYKPTLENLVAAWNAEEDYSHGYLVAPFAVLMLWVRRESLPKQSSIPGWGGIFLTVLAIIVRYVGGWMLWSSFAGWSLVLWLGGVVWIAAGWRGFIWAGPALLFLFFMIPLPFRIEQLLSWQLQTITTNFSAFLLECLCHRDR